MKNKIFMRVIALCIAMIFITSAVSCAKNNAPVDESVPSEAEETSSASSETDNQSTPEAPKPQKPQENTYELKDITENLKLHGRMSTVNSGITCDFTASGIEFTVRAVGKVKLKVTATKDTYFSVWVDGKRQDKRLYAADMAINLTLADFEEEGEHTIKVLKQTEAQWSLCVLNSLTFAGELKEAPANAAKYIEFIGDSIVCGHGNLCLSGEDGQGNATQEDGTTAFAYRAAERLGVDCSIIGCSGVGIDKGFTSFSEKDFYPKTSYYRSTSELYDFERTPDLVVINLGTNDNTKGTTKDAYVSGVKSFIAYVRQQYGDVKIVWTYGMMTEETTSPWLLEAIEELGGEANGLYTLKLNKNREGGNGHPVEDAHELAGRTLARFITDNNLLG